MGIYINGIGCISPQQSVDRKTFSNNILFENRYRCIEPNYSQFIDSKLIRRMSRIIKMGVTSSIIALKNAEIERPQAIIVGTALGCLEDTNTFLSKMIQFEEEMLSPTAFIHSTHNSIASQIALLFQCQVYNSTYVHRTISFESALNDAILLLEEGEIQNALIGGIDEMTETSYTIMNRLELFKNTTLTNQDNFYKQGKGFIPGEGSNFFVLSTELTKHSYAKIIASKTFLFCSLHEIATIAKEIMDDNKISNIDLLITGNNGNSEDDYIYSEFAKLMNLEDLILKYKHCCGEYPTSSAYGMTIAAEIIKGQHLTQNYECEISTQPKTILCYNQSKGDHHSITFLSAC